LLPKPSELTTRNYFVTYYVTYCITYFKEVLNLILGLEASYPDSGFSIVPVKYWDKTAKCAMNP
jgi:hypothetical protein